MQSTNTNTNRHSSATSITSSNTLNSPKINLSTKLNKIMKNDLKELEKVVANSSKQTNLNIRQQLSNFKSSKDESTPRLPNSKTLITPLKRYTTNRTNVSIQDIQNKSNQIFYMKGKPIQPVPPPSQPKIKTDRSDEGIDEYISDIEASSDDEDADAEFKLHPNLNTPATTQIDLTELTSFYESTRNYLENSKQMNPEYENKNVERILAEYYVNRIKSFYVNKSKPAILAQTGTSGLAQMSQRPKPSVKYKTLRKTSPKKVKTQDDLKEEAELDMINNGNLNETERQQLELEHQVKQMVREAKKIANTNKKVKSVHKKIQSATALLNDKTNSEVGDNTSINSNESGIIPNEKFLLKSVESLISAIKSGQLKKEQELSNKKIFDILGTILDKESISMFDSMFNQDNKQDEIDLTQNETVDITINIQGAEDQTIFEQTNENENLLKIDDTNTKLSDHLDPTSLKPSQLSEKHPDSKIKSRSTHTYILDPSVRSPENQILNESYEDEMELYLASLPAKVTKEDVLSTEAKQINLISRVKKEDDIISTLSHTTKRQDKLACTEEKFQRNLHLFCMLEHERQNFLLLPDELINVTRKYHTRSKYENIINNPKKKKEQNSASSALTNNLFTSMSTNNPNDFIKSRLEDGAQRLIDNLNVKFESQLNNNKDVNIKDDIKLDDNKSVHDSGVGDMETSLDTWRMQAEHAVQETFGLNVIKSGLNQTNTLMEFTLRYLRPSPPKMSVKPSYIRKNLFPKYKSLPPPQFHAKSSHHSSSSSHKKISAIKKRSTLNNSNSNNSQTGAYEYINENEYDEDEEDLIDDSYLEMQYIIEKALNRRYNSETRLDKLREEQQEDEIESDFDSNQTYRSEDEWIFKKESRLVRTLSDSIMNRSKKQASKQYGYYNNTIIDDTEVEFMKIDSNYNDAIQEAFYQKSKIKEAHLRKQLSEESKLIASNTNIGIGTSENVKKPKKSIAPKDKNTIIEEMDTDEEIKLIEDDNNDNIEPTKQVDSSSNKAYFPKRMNKKSLAEQALEAGRNYVIMPLKKSSKKRTQKSHNYKKLSLDLLDRIETDMYESNVKKLTRSESMDKIKFKRRIKNADDILLTVPQKSRIKRNPSVDDLQSFEEFKKKQKYNESRWSTNTDDFYNNEREWVRDIWNIWFDDLIPKLDGTNPWASASTNKKSADSQLPAQPELTREQKNAKHTLMVVDSYLQNPSSKSIDEDEQILIRKSPTPYDTYTQIDFDLNDESIVDFESIKLINTEIDKLTKRIENKANAFDLARRGTLYRKLGSIKLALDDLTKSIYLEPKFADAYWQRHLIYLVQNKKNDALEDLNLLLKYNRAHSGAYVSRGDLYAERNDTSLAIVNYSQAIKYNPNDYQTYFKRAKMYEARGDFRMAMDDYLTTTKLNPKVCEAWFKHGMNYFNNKNWHYAIVDFTELIKHNPTNAEARLYRGKCYLNLEDYQQAIDDFSVAIHLNPHDWQSFYHRGCLLRKLDPRQALQDLSVSILIESGYDNINSYLHRAILYNDNERYDEAIQDYQTVLQLDKMFAPAYCNLGIIYMKINMNYWLAIKQFNMAIKSNPVYIRAYLCRAQAFRIIHDLKRAYLDYSKAIHLDPMNTQIYIYRGQVILEMGNLKLAAFCVQHAAFMNDNLSKKHHRSNTLTDQTMIPAQGRLLSSRNYNTNSKMAGGGPSLSRFSRMTTQSNQSTTSNVNHSVTQQALVYLFLKNYKKAVEILERELRIKPSTEIFNLLGRVNMKSKTWDAAVDAFEKSISLNIDDGKGDIPGNSSVIASSPTKMLQANALNFNKKDLIDAYFMRGQCLNELFRFKDALISFDKVIEIQPEYALAYYYRGLTKYHLHNNRCIQDFNRALSINPDLFEAFLARACIYSMQDRYTKAILNCNQAIKLNPKSVRGYLYRGALKYKSNSFEYAILDLTEAIKLDQTCSLAYFDRALCYQKIKQYKNAIKDFSVVLMLGNYLKFKTLINRGIIYFHLEDYSNSLKDFTMSLEFLPLDHKIHHMIGLCLHKLGRYKEAIDKLTYSFHLDNSFHDSLLSRGNVYVDYGHKESFEKAKSDYETVLAVNDKNIDAHINLAYLFQITGRFKKSWDQFTRAIQINQTNPTLFEGRAIVCLQMSNTTAALKDINEAIRLKSSAELFVNRGVIHQFMADNVNAMRDYQSAILMNPAYGLAYFNSANIYMIHKQYDQALNNLNIAIDKCNMKDESTFQNRAIVKALQNDTSGAFKDLCEAIKYDKYSAHIYLNRALLLYKMGNYYLAEKDLNTAINLSQNDALLYKLRADCRGKLEMKEEAINDYKMAIDLQYRNELKVKVY